MSSAIIISGDLMLKQGLGGNPEKIYGILYETSDFATFSTPTKELEIFRFKSTVCWVSSTNANDKGLFVINDSHNCCMFYFESGSQSDLNQWLKAFHNTGWKISTAVHKQTPQQYQDKLYQIKSRDQFDPSQLKYASLSLSNSVNFNSIEIMGRSRSINTQNQMERSMSLPSLLQTELEAKNAQTCEDLPHGDEEEVDDEDERNGVKLRQPNGKRDLVRLQPQTSIYRRSNAAESGYCSKESLLISEAEKTLPSPIKNKQFILAVPYNVKDDILVSFSSVKDYLCRSVLCIYLYINTLPLGGCVS